jgi:acyl carrier protein
LVLFTTNDQPKTTKIPPKTTIQPLNRPEYQINRTNLLLFCPYNYLCSHIKLKNSLTMSEIAGKVKAIIVDKLGVDEKEVTETASFTNDLGADSLDTVELIMEFEKEFNIAIPDDQAEKINTVGEAIKYIQEHAK